MITAVDTNVLLDILVGDEPQGQHSARALLAARQDGAVIASDVVWAETAAWFATPAEMAITMGGLGIDYDALDQGAATLGGMISRAYRSDGGSRARLMPDFLVGAHALTQAERLLTRDRGFFRRYFAELVVIDPGRG